MDENEVLSHIDKMVEIWGDILVPIYSDKENYLGVAQLLGTGFLAAYNDKIYLVTALHVIKDHESKLLIIGIGNKGVPLSKMPFTISEEDDLAITQLNQLWARENDVGKVKGISIEDVKNSYKPLDRHFLIGFPGNKNVLNPKVGKINKNIYGISFIA